MSPPLAFRAYRGSDASFVYSAWINSYKDSERAGIIPDHVFYGVTKTVVNSLMARGMQIILAVNPDDDDQLVGFIAYEPSVLHYCFVKDIFRRTGVAKALLEFADLGNPTACTFWTSDAKYLERALGRRLLYRRKLACRKQPYNADKDGPLG